MSGDDNITNLSKKLASSEQRIREKSLEDLRSWMSRSPFDKINEDDMMKLWLGLYMSMWMADKPLVQEKLAVNLASLVDCLSNSNEVFRFIGAFFKIIRREWSKIDRLRIDKFYMLIRTMLGCTFRYLRQQEWDERIIDLYLQLMPEALNISQTFAVADGITFHLVDVFLDELKRAYDSHLSNDTVVILLRPFVNLLATTPDVALRKAITEAVFDPLAVKKVVGKLSIDPTAMATEFYNVAKDSSLPRSTANRKCLYQLRERFANIQIPVDCENQESEQRDVVVSKGSKKRKGAGVDDNKEIRKKKRKQKSMNDKEPSSDIETISNNDVMTTKDIIDDKTVSSYHSNNDATVSDVRLKLTKKPWELRKRSLDHVAVPMIHHHKQKKQRSLSNPSPPSESRGTLLEDSTHKDLHQRRIPSPIKIVTRSGRQVGGPVVKDHQSILKSLVTDDKVSSSSSKKVHFSILKNEIFDYQQSTSKYTTRRKSSRF